MEDTVWRSSASRSKRHDAGNVYPKSGLVVTAGGVILFAGNDSKLYGVNSAPAR